MSNFSKDYQKGYLDAQKDMKEDYEERIAELEDKLAMAEQISGEYCDKCGWAMKFPDEPCRCELVKRIAELERAISTHRTARHSAGAPEDWDLWKLVDNTNE